VLQYPSKKVLNNTWFYSIRPNKVFKTKWFYSIGCNQCWKTSCVVNLSTGNVEEKNNGLLATGHADKPKVFWGTSPSKHQQRPGPRIPGLCNQHISGTLCSTCRVLLRCATSGRCSMYRVPPSKMQFCTVCFTTCRMCEFPGEVQTNSNMCREHLGDVRTCSGELPIHFPYTPGHVNSGAITRTIQLHKCTHVETYSACLVQPLFTGDAQILQNKLKAYD